MMEVNHDENTLLVSQNAKPGQVKGVNGWDRNVFGFFTSVTVHKHRTGNFNNTWKRKNVFVK